MTREERQEIERLVLVILEKKFQEYGLEKPTDDDRRFVSMDYVCSQLLISRQTFTNWRKHKQLQKLIIPFTRGTERSLAFDFKGLRQSLIEKGAIYGLRSGMIELLKCKTVSERKQLKDKKSRALSLEDITN
jgi:hypothetical protein